MCRASSIPFPGSSVPVIGECRFVAVIRSLRGSNVAVAMGRWDRRTVPSVSAGAAISERADGVAGAGRAEGALCPGACVTSSGASPERRKMTARTIARTAEAGSRTQGLRDLRTHGPTDPFSILERYASTQPRARIDLHQIANGAIDRLVDRPPRKATVTHANTQSPPASASGRAALRRRAISPFRRAPQASARSRRTCARRSLPAATHPAACAAACRSVS